jgi:hypothetical protein
VVIGPGWLSASDELSRRRLDQPDDFVRIEIETALRSKIPLIPVLVMGATMPRGDELSADLAPLARRNAVEISSNHFMSDLEILVAGIERIWREGDERDAEARRQVERDAAARRQAERDVETHRQAERDAEARRRQAERDAQARRQVEPEVGQGLWERPATKQARKRTIKGSVVALVAGAVVVAAVAASTIWLTPGSKLSYPDLQRMSASPTSCMESGGAETTTSGGEVVTAIATATCSDGKFIAWNTYEDAASFAITQTGATPGSCGEPPQAGQARFEKLTSSAGLVYGLACQSSTNGASATYQLRWFRQDGLYTGIKDFASQIEYVSFYAQLKTRMA